MKLSISNLAWGPPADEAVAMRLHARRVTAIDVVPGKYISDLARPSEEEASRARDWWLNRGISIVGLQALLFGTTGLNVFGTVHSRQAMLLHLAQVAKVGRWLGGTRLVFGSPRNRDRGALSDGAVERLSTSFFRQLGDIGQGEGVIFCLEPNPKAYDCNFMTTTLEAATVVRTVNHPGIRLQLDTGTIAMNGEDPTSLISQISDVIGHIHLSEPNLVELGSGPTPHTRIAAELARHPILQIATVEMKPISPETSANVEAIDRALGFVLSLYARESR